VLTDVVNKMIYRSESLTDTGEAAARSRGLWGNDDSRSQRRQRCRECEELQQRLQYSERLRACLLCVKWHNLVWSITKICRALLELRRR